MDRDSFTRAHEMFVSRASGGCRIEVTTPVFSGRSSKDAKTLHVLGTKKKKTNNINHISLCRDDVQLRRHGDLWVFGRTHCRAPAWAWCSSSSLWQPEVVRLLGLCSTDALTSGGRSLKTRRRGKTTNQPTRREKVPVCAVMIYSVFVWGFLHRGAQCLQQPFIKGREKKKTSQLHLLSFTHQSPDALLH
ncbi:hypothetical protein INR49_017772 [Caranx melampygus]|nr:hypothetical protein INR49_017772 [Caranx melampygus]